MKIIIDYLNYDVFLLIFSLLSDKDKISFAITNKHMSQYIGFLIYTDLHQYELVRFLPFRKNFRRLSFRPRYDIVPPVITDLIIDKKFIGSLQNAIPNSVENLQIDFDIYEENKSFIRKDIRILIKYPYIGYKSISCQTVSYIHSYMGFNTEDGLLINNNNLRMSRSISERYKGKEGRIRSNMSGKRHDVKSLLEYLDSTCIPIENMLCNDDESSIKPQSKYHRQKKFRNNFSSQNKFHHQKNSPRQKFSKFYR
ncbi:hypothetical protein qu_916 [Acanthamoeba polyphaga mimivirus]|nr:hypothetical protein [Mimivirus reunion]WMV62250.1 hypothetical protein qu_916 [Mimivirus sp.]WMV63227.1 hypothetical protein qu_916 [Acanthamoeba polyphaga mimivirus]WMV64204.1 hypothetical protein qu_916 [Mimivirus sp.]